MSVRRQRYLLTFAALNWIVVYSNVFDGKKSYKLVIFCPILLIFSRLFIIWFCGVKSCWTYESGLFTICLPRQMYFTLTLINKVFDTVVHTWTVFVIDQYFSVSVVEIYSFCGFCSFSSSFVHSLFWHQTVPELVRWTKTSRRWIAYLLTAQNVLVGQDTQYNITAFLALCLADPYLKEDDLKARMSSTSRYKRNLTPHRRFVADRVLSGLIW